MKIKKLFWVLAAFLILGFWGFSKYRAANIEVSKENDQGKRTLHLYAMSDYFPDAILKDFETKNNCQVRYDNFASNEELLAKLQAGATGYDVIVPSDYMVRSLIGGKLIQELDKALIPNFKNLAKDFVQVPYFFSLDLF